MDQAPPPQQFQQYQQQADANHLKLLAIFHFVVAGLAVLGIGFLLLHFMFMNSIFGNPKMWEGQKGGPPPEEFWRFFQWFYVVMGGFLILGSVGNLLSGLWLRARRNRVFSIIVAAINCCQVPLGTVLGVFTIVVLMRDSVRQLYAETEARGT
jgi:hypothetical protein